MKHCFDAIIVLGGGVSSKDWKARVDKAVQLHGKWLAPRIIMSGKFGALQKRAVTEADEMRRYAISRGVKGEAILKEEESRDTVGNAFFTRKNVLEPNGWKKIIVVTSDYHVPRARMIFKKVLGKKYLIKFESAKPGLLPQEMRECVKRKKTLRAEEKALMRIVPEAELELIEKLLF